MNNELAKAMVDAIRNQWGLKGNRLDSKHIYEELTAKGVKIPEGDMNEILDYFKRAGVINGLGYMNSTGVRQHGAMAIGQVNLDLLDQLDFD